MMYLRREAHESVEASDIQSSVIQNFIMSHCPSVSVLCRLVIQKWKITASSNLVQFSIANNSGCHFEVMRSKVMSSPKAQVQTVP